MKVLYLVVGTEDKICAETKASIIPNLKDGDTYDVAIVDDRDYYPSLRDSVIGLGKGQYDYVCVIRDGAVLSQNYRSLVSEYIKDDVKSVYLTLVVLNHTDEVKGVLNSSIIRYGKEAGMLTLEHEDALLQIDTSLYGAMIPFEVFFDPNNYNEELKYYQHYHFLNQFTQNQDNYVYLIPKLISNLNYDLSYSHIDKEIKLENYKLAKELKVEVMNEQE